MVLINHGSASDEAWQLAAGSGRGGSYGQIKIASRYDERQQLPTCTPCRAPHPDALVFIVL